MARQKGMIKTIGRIGDLVGYRLNGRYVVRALPNVTKERIQTDPAYAETRKTGTEFGRVSKAGKLLRDTLRPFIREVAQKQLDNPVNKLLSTIKNSDPSPKGERTVSGGLAQSGMPILLDDFEFNDAFRVSRFCHIPYSVNTTDGVITFGPFKGESAFQWPKLATHAIVSVCSAQIDFAGNSGAISVSDEATIGASDPSQSFDLGVVPPSGEGLQLLVLKIVFIRDDIYGREFLKGGAVVAGVRFG